MILRRMVLFCRIYKVRLWKNKEASLRSNQVIIELFIFKLTRMLPEYLAKEKSEIDLRNIQL